MSLYAPAYGMWSTKDTHGHFDIAAGDIPTNNQITYKDIKQGTDVILRWTVTSANVYDCTTYKEITVHNYGFTLPQDQYYVTNCSDDYTLNATLPHDDPNEYEGTWTRYGGAATSMTSANNARSLTITGLSRSLDNVFLWHVKSKTYGCEDDQWFSVRNPKPSDAEISMSQTPFR